MHRTSLAPVLSATLQRVSCWITVSPSLLPVSTISTTRQRFDFDSGRVSITRTVSPTCASFASSCAASFDDRRTILPYSACRICRSMRTRTVLSISSDTTTPVRIFRGAALERRLSPSLTARSPPFVAAERVELQLDLALAEHRGDTRHVVADLLHPRGVVQLARGELEAQVEQLLLAPPPSATTSSSSGSSRSSAALLVASLVPHPRDELRLDRQLVLGAAHGLARERLPARRPARTSRGPASRRRPSPPGCPCRSPCGSRPASSSPACPGRC